MSDVKCPRCELFKPTLLLTAKHGAMCIACLDKVYARVFNTLNNHRIVGEHKETTVA